MIDVEKLAIECGAVKYEAEVPQVYFMTEIDLTNFAKAYLNEWLKEQEVVGYMNAHGMVVSGESKGYGGFDTPLIAIPSEVK